MSENAADDLLRSGYERWYRLEEEKAAIGDDLKELFAELKGQGFTPKALRESFRRVRNINDASQQEHDAIVDLYVASLTGARPAHTRVENIAEFGAETGEITEPRDAEVAGSPAQMPSADGVAPGHGLGSTSPDRVEGIVDGQPIQPETADDDRSCVSVLGGLAQSLQQQATREGEAARPLPPTISETDKSVEASASAAPLYAEPGIVVMENAPPEGIVAHPYAACWPVNNIDVSEGVRDPIVKIGNLILDGRGRYFAARAALIDYPVVQYDGSDALLDSIRWNMASRPGLHPHNLNIIATKLVKLEPARADDIMQAMGLEQAEAAE